jgi:hypothetical protein
VLCNDVPQLCDGLAGVTKDILVAMFDGAFFTMRLAQLTSPGWSVVSWAYITTAVVAVRGLSPNFGKMQSIRSKLNDAFQRALGEMITHPPAVW